MLLRDLAQRGAGVGLVRGVVGVEDLTQHKDVAPPRIGSGNEATGLRTRSEAWPSAWFVLEPSKPQIGRPAPSARILVFDLSLAVGRVPSIQMYSALYGMVVLSVGVCASGDNRKVDEGMRGGLLTGVLGLQEIGHRGVLASPGVGQRRTSPAVGGPWPGPVAEQESDCSEVSLGGGKVQPGPAVVIGSVGVGPGGESRPQFIQVALARRVQQPHSPVDLGFVLLPARITLTGLFADSQ